MSNFRRSIIQLASGTAASQAIVLLMTPALTRVLGPASFGALAVFSSAYVVLAGVFTMKFEQSILLPREDAEAVALTALTVHLSAGLSFALLAGLSLAVGAGRVPAYWLALPLCTLLAAVNSSVQQWGARLRNYRTYSSGLVVGAIVNSALGLALALVLGDSPAALIVGFTCGLAASVGFALVRQRAGFGQVVAAGPSRWQSKAALASRYREFPVHVLPTSLAVGAASYMPPVLLGAVYSLSTTGYYAIATKFVLLPSILLGGAISEAFRAEFMARMRDSVALAGFTRSLLLKMTLVAVPVCILMALLAPWAFGLAFGAKYAYSGELVRYIVPGALGALIAQPFQCVFVGLRRSGIGLVLQLTLSAGPLSLLYFAALHGPIERALLWHSLSMLVLSLLTAGVAWRLTSRVDHEAGFARA